MTRALWLTALVACAAQGDPLWTRAVPRYPATTPIALGGELEAMGERYRLSFFVTADPPERVARYFVTQFRDSGLPVRTAGAGSPDCVVAGFATREGLVHAVVLHFHEGRTLGFGVLKDGRSFRSDVGATSVPLLEGTLLADSAATRAGTFRQLQRTSIVDRPLQRTRVELLQSLKAEGWELVQERGEKARLVEHRKGTVLLQSVLLELEPGITGVQQMHAVAGEGDDGFRNGTVDGGSWRAPGSR